jgi:hypothetical protein
VNEDILAAVIRLDESEALLTVEPLHCALRHMSLSFRVRVQCACACCCVCIWSRAWAPDPLCFEFWKKVVSPTRWSRRGQVVRPKLDPNRICRGSPLRKLANWRTARELAARIGGQAGG